MKLVMRHSVGLFLLAWMLSGAASVAAQTSIVVISNPACPDNTVLSFGGPVDNNPGHFINVADFFVFRKGVAMKTFTWTKPSFILLTGNRYCPKKRLLVCPGDTIRLEVSENNEVTFAGDNAAGLYEYNDGKALIMGHVPIAEIIVGSKSKEKVIEELERMKSEVFLPMIKLYHEQKVSKPFFEYAQKEADQIFSWAVKGYIYLAKKLTEEEKTEAVCYFYRKYNPCLEMYKDIHSANRNIIDKGRLMAEGLFPKNSYTDLGLWDDTKDWYNFAPGEVQEQSFADGIQVRHTIMGTMSDESFEKAIEQLKSAFPASIYLPFLERTKDEKHNSENALGLFICDNINGLTKVDTFPSMNLESLVKKYFKGTPVLVDLWATYCAPCKQEFRHKDRLKEFLDSRGIKLLYCSVDNPDNSVKWEKDALDYELYGYHYFITSNADGYLRKLLGGTLYIPQYFLFDKEGNLVKTGLSRPSAKERMFWEIEEVVSQ